MDAHVAWQTIGEVHPLLGIVRRKREAAGTSDGNNLFH